MEASNLDNYSYQDYLDIDSTTNDDTRVELIFGEIFMMSGCSAAHQDTVGNIYFQLRSKKTTNCVVRVAPFDIKIILNNYTSVVQPDLMVICENATLPCAVFEVLSPSTAAKDKGIKKDLYQLEIGLLKGI